VDIDVIVNLRARRGSAKVADACGRELPGARVLLSRDPAEAVEFIRANESGRRSLLVSAGGDGTALGAVNAFRADVLRLGLLPLGTGNAWAHASGAPGWRSGIARLGAFLRAGTPPPLRRFRLVEIQGAAARGASLLSHFAGTGWDAEVIDDFRRQKDGLGILPFSWRRGLAGYLQGVFTRTIPRHLVTPLAEVEITNLGSPALIVDADGRAVPVPGGEAGQVIYRGPAGVCAAGTIETWGFGFRAFPFANLHPDRFCLRIYGGTAAQAAVRMRPLWRGAHPVAKMHNFLLDRCRAVFSRPVPFQAGGDPLGHRQEIEYGLADETVDILDWSRLPSA